MKKTICGLMLMLPLLALCAAAFGAETSVQEANSLFKTDQFADARQGFLTLATQTGDTSAALALRVRAAQCLLELDDFAGAKQECEGLLTQYATSPNTAALLQARHLLAAIPYRQKNWAEAAEVLGQFIRDNPGDPDLVYCVSNRAEALEALRRYGEARQVLLDYAAQHAGQPQAGELKFRAARCRLWQKDYAGFKEEMEGVLPELAANKPLQQKALGLLAQAPFHLGQWAEAEAALGRFLSEQTGAPAAYLYDAARMRGAALCRLKRFGEARQALLGFAEKNPALPEAREARWRAALCLFDQGDYSAFASEAQPLAGLDAERPNASAALLRMRLAHVPGKQGRWLEMAQAMERLIPDEALGENLDWVQIHCGEGYVKAARELEQKGEAAQARQLREKGRQVLAEVRARLEGQRAAAKDDQALGDQARTRILDTYYMEEDYAGILREAAVMVEESRAPSLAWGKAMAWLGVAKCKQSPPDWDGAALALDAVLAAGVTDNSIEEHVPSTAAYWRAVVAQAQKDDGALKAALEQLKAMPEGPIKQAALARYPSALP